MDLRKIRYLKGEPEVSGVYLGSNQVWPTFYNWENIGLWPSQSQLTNLPLTETGQGYVMSVYEKVINPTKTLFFIATSLVYDNNNRGKIKIFTFNTQTNLFKEQLFTNSSLQVGYATGDYYGRSMAWDKNSLSLIVGAPRTLNYNSTAQGDGLIRILEVKEEDYSLEVFKFGLKGEHYNWNGFDPGAINNNSGWIAGRKWSANGQVAPTFGWSVALSSDGVSAFASAPAANANGAGVGEGVVYKRDFNTGTKTWQQAGTDNGYGSTPWKFTYSYPFASANWKWMPVSPTWFGMEILCYRKDGSREEEFLVARTAKNRPNQSNEINGVAIFKIRSNFKTNKPPYTDTWTTPVDQQLEYSRMRVISFPQLGNETYAQSFNWDDSPSNLRKTLAAGDNIVVVSTTGAAYCFRQDIDLTVDKRKDYSPWKTITFDSCGLATTGTQNNYRKFGSTVNASQRLTTNFNQGPATLIVSQENDFDTQNRGSYTAFKYFGENNSSPSDLFPYSQDVMETGSSQDYAGYCTFVSSAGDYIISTSPGAFVDVVGTSPVIKRQSGTIKVWKRIPRI